MPRSEYWVFVTLMFFGKSGSSVAAGLLASMSTAAHSSQCLATVSITHCVPASRTSRASYTSMSTRPLSYRLAREMTTVCLSGVMSIPTQVVFGVSVGGDCTTQAFQSSSLMAVCTAASASASHMPRASRRKSSSLNSRKRLMASKLVRFPRVGLALRHVVFAAGLSVRFAPNSTHRLFDASPSQARLRRVENASLGSSGLGGVPIIM